MRNLILFVLSAFLLAGCSGKPGDARLLEISEKVSDHPEDMLARLDSIEVGSLDEADRYFHALLTIKAQDKAFIRHTSDSVAVKVIDYYSRHKGSGLYPEALYYGGRVYSDIGDAPTALRYFHDALDALPEGMDDDLRSRIYSQMADLFNSLRLYNEAAICIKETLRLTSAAGDSLSLMHAVQLLGAVYMHSKEYDKADSCFRQALNIGRITHNEDTVIQRMYIAGNNLYRGYVEGALAEIRKVLQQMKDNEREIVYAYAAQIYIEAEIPDTAYLFASRLKDSKNNNRRKTGYSMLLSPGLRRFSSHDSLISYTIAYKDVLDNYLDRHDAGQVALQTSLYNYQTHERVRIKAEKARRKYKYLFETAVLLVCILCSVILYMRNKRMKTLLRYRKALDDIAFLRKTLSSLQQAEQENVSDCATESPWPDEYRQKNELRDRLKEELLVLQRAGEVKKDVPERILQSTAYVRLREYLDKGMVIPGSESLWLSLEEEVLEVSPEFKKRLYLLAGDRLKEDAYHMALLIKCGITPTDLTVLMGRSKGAVSSRRGYICEMLFGQKLGAKVMDDIVRLL